MAQLGGTFDPSAVPEDERSFDLLPTGPQPAQITESEVVETKSGGQMLKLTWQIIEGQYVNRKLWQNINIQNKNPEAESIGARELASICTATGAGAIKDSEELHFKPCTITVGIEKDKNGVYADKNKVSRVSPLGGTPVKRGASPKAAAATSKPALASAVSSRPWSK